MSVRSIFTMNDNDDRYKSGRSSTRVSIFCDYKASLLSISSKQPDNYHGAPKLYRSLRSLTKCVSDG